MQADMQADMQAAQVDTHDSRHVVTHAFERENQRLWKFRASSNKLLLANHRGRCSGRRQKAYVAPYHSLIDVRVFSTFGLALLLSSFHLLYVCSRLTVRYVALVLSCLSDEYLNTQRSLQKISSSTPPNYGKAYCARLKTPELYISIFEEKFRNNVKYLLHYPRPTSERVNHREKRC